jgi:hypothetical protein
VGAGALQRSMHRVHRAVGSAFALLIAVWFASGAVMTFSGYPRLTDRERMALAPTLPHGAAVAIPAPLARDLPALLAAGRRVRLAMHENITTWLTTDESGERRVYRARDEWRVSELDGQRARAEAERRFSLRAHSVERLAESDQWTVAIASPATFPLFQVRFSDSARTEAYVASRTGELLQVTTRRERIWAWLGAIPHWVYPTILRRERELWRYTVLTLSALGLLITVSGSIIGLHVHRATRHRRAPRDRYLRWHQTLGLWFGLFASTWLLSGAVSLSPFQWAGPRAPTAREQNALYGALGVNVPHDLGRVLARCQRELAVKELELVAWGGKPYAVCSESQTRSRMVDLTVPEALPQPQVDSATMHGLAGRLARHAPGHSLEAASSYDDYYYPTHTSPDAVLPYFRIALQDAERTVYYVDPVRLRLLRKHTRLTRLERWLYHGLHSFDFRPLYERRTLWLLLVNGAMFIGFVLSGLGGLLWWRRKRRAVRRRERDRTRSDQKLAQTFS